MLEEVKIINANSSNINFFIIEIYFEIIQYGRRKNHWIIRNTLVIRFNNYVIYLEGLNLLKEGEIQ